MKAIARLFLLKSITLEVMNKVIFSLEIIYHNANDEFYKHKIFPNSWSQPLYIF